MAKDAQGNGLVYVDTVDGFSRYEMYLSGRPVMHVTVDNTSLAIRVERVSIIGGKRLGFTLKMKAMMSLFSEKTGPGDADVTITEHVDSLHLQKVIYTKLSWLLADLYVVGTVELT